MNRFSTAALLAILLPQGAFALPATRLDGPGVILVKDAVDDPQSRVFLESFGLDAIKPTVVPAGKRVFLTSSLTIYETGGSSTYDKLAKITVRWRQVGGPPVQIDNAAGRKASFVSPQEAGEYSFTVTMTNKAGTRDGTLKVTVDPNLKR